MNPPYSKNIYEWMLLHSRIANSVIASFTCQLKPYKDKNVIASLWFIAGSSNRGLTTL